MLRCVQHDTRVCTFFLPGRTIQYQSTAVILQMTFYAFKIGESCRSDLLHKAGAICLTGVIRTPYLNDL
jgi:hypothetical protein